MHTESLWYICIISGNRSYSRIFKLLTCSKEFIPVCRYLINTCFFEKLFIVKISICLKLIWNLFKYTFIIASEKLHHCRVGTRLIITFFNQILKTYNTITVIALVSLSVKEVNLLFCIKCRNQTFFNSFTSLKLYFNFYTGFFFISFYGLGNNNSLWLCSFPV